MLKIFFLAAALVLLAGCRIDRPNEIRANEEKQVVQEEVVKTIKMPPNMRFLQYDRGQYIFEEYLPGSAKQTRVVIMYPPQNGHGWRRVMHLE